MQTQFHKKFVKQYKNLQKIKDKIDERIELFIDNPYHPLLNNHILHGEYDGYRSINISGDYRAVYRESQVDIVIFVAVGTHNELYS